MGSRARPAMVFKRMGFSVIILVAANTLFFTKAFSANTPTKPNVPASAGAIQTGTYSVPEYSQKKLPSISSCDGSGSKEDALDELPSSGNAYMDAVTTTAVKLNKVYGRNAKDDSSSEDEDVDGKATIDTDCEAIKASDSLGIDKDTLACPMSEDTLNQLLEAKKESNKYLACKRGVLDALKGEIGCFKRQIADAEGYMNDLVSGQGGLADMLKNGNDQITQIDGEINDRSAQMQAANERIEGGEGGNPPGLRQAKDMMTELATKIPARVTQVAQQVENLKNQESRFNTLVSQVTLGRTMACLNKSTSGYRCVKNGTASTKYKSGSVSPIDYVKCLYSQSANVLVGGSTVKNSSAEDALIAESTSNFDLNAQSIPSAVDLPSYSDSKGFEASMKTYKVKSAADIKSLYSPFLSQMDSKSKKNITAQFNSDVDRCFKESAKEVADDRKDSNSQIKAQETAMYQSFDRTRSDNAGAFRELRDTYAKAIKAATGKSVMINTTACENAKLEDQSKCFDAFSSMTDAILTGTVSPTSERLTGPAAALTAGQAPVHTFTSDLEAKTDKNRAIHVVCNGVDDCLTQYTNIRSKLKQTVDERKQFKTNFATQVNNKLLQTAKDLASKGVVGAGQAGIQQGTITLNTVAANVARRKTQLETLMSKFGVDAGLDLDPKEIGDPVVDANGLYRPADLKKLVMSEITPGLPDANSRGFSETIKAVGDRDKELSKLQDALDTDYSAAVSKAKTCEKDTKKAFCEQANEFWEKCKNDAKEDPMTKLIDSFLSKADLLDEMGKSAEAETKRKRAEELIAKQKNGQIDKNSAPDATALTCGTAPQVYAEFCPLGQAVSTNKFKPNQTTGNNKNGSGQNVAPVK